MPAPANVWALQLADLDKDGRRDALMIEWGGTALSIAKAQVSGFSVPNTQMLPAGALALGVGDLDRDGSLDALLLYSGSGMNLGYLAGKGDGRFGDSRPLALDGRSIASQDWLLTDWNGDGWHDLLSIRSNSELQLNRGLPVTAGMLPEFAEAKRFDMPFPMRLAAGDVTGDGRPDLVVASDGGAGLISVLRNRSR